MRINPVSMLYNNSVNANISKTNNKQLAKTEQSKDGLNKSTSFKGFSSTFESIYSNLPSTQIEIKESFKKLLKSALDENSFFIHKSELLRDSLKVDKLALYIIDKLRYFDNSYNLISSSNGESVVTADINSDSHSSIKFNSLEPSNNRYIEFTYNANNDELSVSKFDKMEFEDYMRRLRQETNWEPDDYRSDYYYYL